MGLTVNARFRRGRYRRECDICGAQGFFRDELKWVDNRSKLACPLCKKGRFSTELDRANAAASKKIRRKPTLNTTPAREVSISAAAEGEIMNLLTARAVAGVPGGALPYAYLDVTGVGEAVPVGGASALAVGLTCQALAALILEDKRPAAMLAAARAKLVVLANWLLAHQIAPTGQGQAHETAQATTVFGHFVDDTGSIFDPVTQVVFYTRTLIACGLGLERAYAVLGTGTFATGAAFALMALRRLQCGGKTVLNPAETHLANDGAARWNSGAWSHAIYIGGGGPS